MQPRPMTKDQMRATACAMLVDLVALGHDMTDLARELIDAYTYGTDAQFRAACVKVGRAYAP